MSNGNTATLEVCSSYKTNTRNWRSGFCPICKDELVKVKNAMDFIVRGCSSCLRTYYYEKKNKRLIELAIPFRDFFEC